MSTTEADILPVLQSCCSCRAPAIILNSESGFVCQARFASVSQESVTFHLSKEISPFPETLSFFVSFSLKGNCCTFFATVLEYLKNPPPSPPSLTLQLPTQIIDIKALRSSRIPIGKKMVPLVRLRTADNRILLPKPVDLSQTGILVEFEEAEDPDLSPSAELGLELYLDPHTVFLKSIVKRRDGHRYGLFFPEVHTKDGIAAPQSFRKIIESLECNAPGQAPLNQRHQKISEH